MTRILFVEDEAPFRRFAGRYLEDRGFELLYAERGDEALEVYGRERPDLLILDLNLPDMHGLEILRRARTTDPEQRVVVLTAYGDAATAVQALKAGATDYLTKPVRLDQLLEAVREALAAPSSQGAVAAADVAKRDNGGGEARAAPAPARGVFGQHPSWLKVLERLERVASSGLSSLLLLGESGTGKSVLARHFHELGAGKNKPFVEINCPSIPEALLESELFGHEKGAFTGATARKKGQVEMAAGGTLFLDEIGELPSAIQPKLLRFLEQRRFRRVGGLEDREADVRLVCATNRDLRRDVETGAFRTDLFYRLEVVAIELPPLRERGDDILTIADNLATSFASQAGRPAPTFTEAAQAALKAHSFPGNVRELRNLIQRALAFMEGEHIDLKDLDLHAAAPTAAAPASETQGEATPGATLPVDLERMLNAVEAHYVCQAVDQTDSQREAGSLLGIDRFAVARRMNRIARSGGRDAAQEVLGSLPTWTQKVLGDHPTELPGEGLDLPALRRELEDRAIGLALRATDGNRARAATLLGMSRTSLVRRLDRKDADIDYGSRRWSSR